MLQKLYIVGYTLVITAIYGGIVSALNVSLTPIIEANQVRAKRMAILQLFDLVDPETESGLPAEEVNRRFEAVQTVTVAEQNGNPYKGGGPYDYYTLKDGNGTVVFPIWGKGFWEPISGFMAADTEKSPPVATDLIFTDQGETPGLGARITERAWRDQFVGKPLAKNPDTGVYFRIRAPSLDNKGNDVDAITGATETSRKTQQLMNKSIARFMAIWKSGGGR